MDRFATEKHLKQNREIIRVNQTQSNRIAALETEITRLLSENIQLRTQVIQLTHRQDHSALKTQLERKIREIHRLVKGLGSGSALTQSPVPPIIKKSPKKSNLLNLSPEHSPDRSSPDFVNVRSKPRSLYGGPSRVSAAMSSISASSTTMDQRLDDDAAVRVESHSEVQLGEEARRESRDRDRETRRASRRMSRSSEEIVPLKSSQLDSQMQNDLQSETTAQGSPRRSGCDTRLLNSSERVARRKSRALNDLGSMADSSSTARRSSRSSVDHEMDLCSEENKENPVRKSTASIRLLHSSPVKSRAALNQIADPLPSNRNIQEVLQTPAKALNEVAEIKSEPTSPQLEITNPPDEEGNVRSRRGKTVNYAEPSLRHKMRRTESLPGEKRRRSTYKQTPTSDGQRRGSYTTQSTITIDED